MTSSAGRIAALASVPVLVLAACGGGGGTSAEGGDRVSVVASFYPIAEAAMRVGGDRVEVTNLTPAGTEPHDLELTPDQVDAIEDADVVLYLGQDFQPAVAEAAQRRDGITVDLFEGIALEEGAGEAGHDHAEDAHAGEDEGEHEGEGEGEHAGEGEDEGEHAGEDEGEHAGEGEGEHAGEGEDAHAGGDDHADEDALDPHFWLDPRLMAEATHRIEAALAEASPEDEQAFVANAERYEDELTALDEDMAAGLADCERDQIVTSHAAFHYLAERYGLTQRPIAGLSPESEPDADRLDRLADEIEDEGITTVFYETLVSPAVAETLAREAGVDTAVLNPLEGLTDDQAEAGEDYGSIMRENLSALTEALDCNA